MKREEQWYDNDAGPLVRLYAVTSGRARASGIDFDLMAAVQATGQLPAPRSLSPEQRLLLRICGQPQTVADVASESNLPVGVVRVLLDDLRNAGLVAVSRPHRPSQLPDQRVLQEVIDGLRAL
jgi:hypothetical protein